MKSNKLLAVVLVLAFAMLVGCTSAEPAETSAPRETPETPNPPETSEPTKPAAASATQPEPAAAFTVDTRIQDVMDDPAFGDYGRLIFPVRFSYMSGDTLGTLDLSWYSHIDPAKTVEIANWMKQQAVAGETIFYDIYTPEEKADDPAKADTGLFFFKGAPGAKFALCNAGGGFAYVGAMHDSFPHALELSKMGYNAFALIYRPGMQNAYEDLARAIRFVFDHGEELEVDTEGYSLWGGSAGGRMAVTLGTYGTGAYGEIELPRPAAVVVEYAPVESYFADNPAIYGCIGERDGIVSWSNMKASIDEMAAFGIDTEFHSYATLGHGFGLGTGTAAEGWLNEAVAFWEKQTQ